MTRWRFISSNRHVRFKSLSGPVASISRRCTLSLGAVEIQRRAERIGEMIGLDRAHREVHVSASTDAEGNEITPPRSVPYDTLVIAVGSTTAGKEG